MHDFGSSHSRHLTTDSFFTQPEQSGYLDAREWQFVRSVARAPDFGIRSEIKEAIFAAAFLWPMTSISLRLWASWALIESTTRNCDITASCDGLQQSPVSNLAGTYVRLSDRRVSAKFRAQTLQAYQVLAWSRNPDDLFIPVFAKCRYLDGPATHGERAATALSCFEQEVAF